MCYIDDPNQCPITITAGLHAVYSSTCLDSTPGLWALAMSLKTGFCLIVYYLKAHQHYQAEIKNG